MEIIKTEIKDVLIIKPRIFEDARGYFLNLSRNEILILKYGTYILYKIMRANQAMEY